MRPTTLILMVDTTAPTFPLAGISTQINYQSFSALVNKLYACRHGYDFLYYQLSEGMAGCAHPIYGRRHPSYCKLPAIARALRKYETVVLLDSDSWFTHWAPPVDEIERAYRVARPLQTPFPSVLFGWDHPYSNGPNCGLMIWHNSKRARELLRTWWHIDSGPYAQQHDYEQRAMHWAVAHLNYFADSIETLQLRALDNDESIAHPIFHVDHTRGNERFWRLGLEVLQIAIEILHVTPQRAMRHAGSSSRSPSGNSSAATSNDLTYHRNEEDDAAVLLRASELLMVSAPSQLRGASRWAATLRRTLLQLALKAGRQLTAHMRNSACARLRARRFNATRAGLALLPPINIESDGHVDSTPQSHISEVDGTTMFKSGGQQNQSDELGHDGLLHNGSRLRITENYGFLDGTPLVLRSCDSSMDTWQIWRATDERSDMVPFMATPADASIAPNASSLLLPTSSIRLEKFPELCLRIGPGHAMREPFLPLAQLGMCADGSGHAPPNHSANVMPIDGTQRFIWHAQYTSTAVGPARQRGSSTVEQPTQLYLALSAIHFPEELLGNLFGSEAFLLTNFSGSASRDANGTKSDPVSDQKASFMSVLQRESRANPWSFLAGSSRDRNPGNSYNMSEAAGYREDSYKSSTTGSSFSVVASNEFGEEGEEPTEPASDSDGSDMHVETSVSVESKVGLQLELARRLQERKGEGQPQSGDYRHKGTSSTSTDAQSRSSVLPAKRGKAAKFKGLGGKHGRWREQNADPERLWKACTSEFQGAGLSKDKHVQDCESWCRPNLKAAHCRHCKCRACRSCHNGSAATPKWELGSYQACVRFGRCDEWMREQANKTLVRNFFWQTRRQGASGGSICNSSSDCSGHGECADWSNATLRTHAAVKLPKTCRCATGYTGARCSFVSFSQLQGGGASCTQVSDCAGQGSSCLKGRCVCGKGWIGAKCSFPSFMAMFRHSGGGSCNSSNDCGGRHQNLSLLVNVSVLFNATPASTNQFAPIHQGGSCVLGRCVCAPLMLGARCSLAAWIAPGGAPCELDQDCSANLSDGGRSGACRQGRCACNAGFAGGHCRFNLVLAAARAAHREEALRARHLDKHLHLCLSAWRQDSVEGAPIAFNLCRRRLKQHQLWVRRPVKRISVNSHAFRIVSGNAPHMCVTVYPMHHLPTESAT